MHPSSKRGNNPEVWTKLLDVLDDKLQLGLLDRLKRIASYHIEDKTLTVQPENDEDYKYLSKSAVSQQLDVFGQEICGCDKISITKPTP